MAKTKKLTKEAILKDMKTLGTIQKVADKYGVCYQTMLNYLKSINYDGGKVGRPRKLIIED